MNDRPDPPEDCIVFCDYDCENGSAHCEDIHVPNHKKRHRDQPCPGIHVCGMGTQYSCCHPDGRDRIIEIEGL